MQDLYKARGKGVSWARETFTLRAKATHSQVTQHRRPTLGHDFAGRNRQPFAPPRVMADAGAGLVVKAHVSEIDAMYDAGDYAAHARHLDLVALLKKPLALEHVW